jgi:hypothetical protein
MCVVLRALLQVTGNDTPTPHPLLWETSHVPLSFQIHSYGLLDLDVLLSQREPRIQPLVLTTIFGNAWACDNAP